MGSSRNTFAFLLEEIIFHLDAGRKCSDYFERSSTLFFIHLAIFLLEETLFLLILKENVLPNSLVCHFREIRMNYWQPLPSLIKNKRKS
jgi:hypothetical protein